MSSTWYYLSLSILFDLSGTLKRRGEYWNRGEKKNSYSKSILIAGGRGCRGEYRTKRDREK
jgi:hypothetical protein